MNLRRVGSQRSVALVVRLHNRSNIKNIVVARYNEDGLRGISIVVHLSRDEISVVKMPELARAAVVNPLDRSADWTYVFVLNQLPRAKPCSVNNDFGIVVVKGSIRVSGSQLLKSPRFKFCSLTSHQGHHVRHRLVLVHYSRAVAIGTPKRLSIGLCVDVREFIPEFLSAMLLGFQAQMRVLAGDVLQCLKFYQLIITSTYKYVAVEKLVHVCHPKAVRVTLLLERVVDLVVLMEKVKDLYRLVLVVAKVGPNWSGRHYLGRAASAGRELPKSCGNLGYHTGSLIIFRPSPVVSDNGDSIAFVKQHPGRGQPADSSPND